MPDEIDEIPTHLTEVVRVQRAGPRFVRITVGGGLDRYVSKGPDDFVYVLRPPPGRIQLGVDESFTWTGYFATDEAERPVGAYYTVRHLRPDDGELDFDVFLHDDPGPISGWATRATVGDPVALWGPRTAFAPPAEVDWWLLVADAAGLPALARVVETLPPDAVVRAVIEVPDPEDEQDLALGPHMTATWVHEDAAADGSSPLVCAVHALDLPDGSPYVWGGGESRVMTAVRRHVRRDLGIAKERVSLTPYWRRPGDVPDDAEADDLDD